MATIWTSGRARMPPISRIAWVPKPMQASVIFSLGGTNPAPPSTWRGTMAKALAATPLAATKRRRETGTDADRTLLFEGARFREESLCGWFMLSNLFRWRRASTLFFLDHLELRLPRRRNSNVLHVSGTA